MRPLLPALLVLSTSCAYVTDLDANARFAPAAAAAFCRTLAELRDLDEISKELNLPLDLGEQSASGQESQDEQQPAEAADDTDHASGKGGSDGGLSMAAQANPELEDMGQAEALARAPVRVNE